MKLENNVLIHPEVLIQDDIIIEPFSYLGAGEFKKQNEEIQLKIGKNARIRSHTVIYLGCYIGDNFSTGHHVLIRELCKIGSNVSIGTGSVIEHHVNIANNVRIHTGAFIPEHSILEEGCWIGPNVVLTNSKYPVSINSKAALQGSIIGKKAKIGANATILPGVKIGKGALIGAGAVITKDVEDFQVVVGNPQKIINHLSNLPYEDIN
jgi:acetyltransferase-like isoleucine patch superfamily enzyme